MAGRLALLEQQPGDQEAAEHEEDVDAQEAALGPGHVGVEQHHGRHGERPEPVELGSIAEGGDAGRHLFTDGDRPGSGSADG